MTHKPRTGGVFCGGILPRFLHVKSAKTSYRLVRRGGRGGGNLSNDSVASNRL